MRRHLRSLPVRLLSSAAWRTALASRTALAWLAAAVWLAAAERPAGADERPVQFGRDVLPILADKCFHCHGPDESHRQADLRLDLREAAIADRGGGPAIAPGSPERSELLARVVSDDPETMMPPPKSHRQRLAPREVELLRRWIADGAVWGRHWAFERPRRAPVPDGPAASPDDAHPIDRIVAARLRSERLDFSPPADKITLLRRLSFDLIGLPPTEAEVDAFLADDQPGAYQRQIDRLLNSPHYGERMAMWWLDAARYSDTDGFQGDATRTNWPWRDWVVQAFNANLPFDRFTIEQFAGDLLPDATPEQILATCFHRNHMTNGEGGRDPEESRIDYVLDRVNTTGAVWLGLTLGCCQCHSHKFDPISQTDYYRLFAYFDSIDETGGAGPGAKPLLDYRSPFAARAVDETRRLVEHRRPQAAAAREAAERRFPDWLAGQANRVRAGFTPWHPLVAVQLSAAEGTELRQEPDGTIQASGPTPRQDDYRIVAPLPDSLKDATLGAAPRLTGLRLEVFPHASHVDGKLSRGGDGEFILTDVKLQVRRKGRSELRDVTIAGAVADVEADAKARRYGKVADTLDDDPRNGWTTRGHDPRSPHTALFALAEPLTLEPDEELIFVLLQRSTAGDANLGRFRVAVTDQPGEAVSKFAPTPLEQLAAHGDRPLEQLDPAVRRRLLEQFLLDQPDYQRAKAALDRAARQLNELQAAAGELKVMVLGRRPEPRKTFVLQRGVWDKKGDEVTPGVIPAVLPWPSERAPSRLELARWIVDPENPLTARVVVNHVWQMYFGAGLVRTVEDFGLQGERPEHPELLDELAVAFVEGGWDLQKLIRSIVTSRTYQQSSVVSAERAARDPDNRLLARGARFRLPSWMLRDAALQASGLLNPALGGPPVRPYQPAGVWEELFMGRYRYEPSEGAAQYRRTVYAFWRRSSAPTFLFDSAQRRTCEVRLPRTNTPLHALTLLNDATQLEAARTLALLAASDPVAQSPGQSVAQRGSIDERLQRIARRVLSRRLDEAELRVLRARWERAEARYRGAPEEAERLLAFDPLEPAPGGDRAALAAAMLAAQTLFNLDEAMTHE